MGQLKNRVALITGAGSGLGKASALTFAQEGAVVILLGRRKSKIDETARTITEFGGTALAIRADIALYGDIRQAVENTVANYGRIDILVNNAAILEPATVMETILSDWEQQLQVNLTGPFMLSQAVLPTMRKQRYGRIINITSSLAVNGAGGFAAYSAAKAGLESLTRTIAEEEGSYNILANLYNPGMIKTEMHGTGKDPAVVTSDLVRLASLPDHSHSGILVNYA